MLRRYELTDDEWNRIVDLLPPENTGKQGRPRKDNRTIVNGMVWIARSGAPWRDLPERYGPWETVYSRFRKWMVPLSRRISTALVQKKGASHRNWPQSRRSKYQNQMFFKHALAIFYLNRFYSFVDNFDESPQD